MTSKKKSKPSFQVPEELQAAPQAGWVYRSDGQAPAKDVEAPPKSAATRKKTRRRKPAARKAAAAAPPHSQPKPAAVSKAPAARKPGSASNSIPGFMNLTARTVSAGFGTAGNIVLLTTRILTVPFSFGRRLLGL